MTDAPQEKNESEVRIKEPASEFSQTGNRQSANRMANKLRKKKAHRRNLRKSNANG